MPSPRPTIYLIAGCNGAGKTTFAKEFLPTEVKCLRFLNADEIARGLSPLKPSASAVQAARLLLLQIEDCLRRRETFALETTLSGKTYSRLFRTRGNSAMRSSYTTSGFPARRKQSPACVSACAWVGITFPLPTFVAASSAASFTCSTPTFRLLRAGYLGQPGTACKTTRYFQHA